MNGLDVFNQACQKLKVDVVPLIVDTAQWVHPDIFKALPVWYPEYYRGCALFNSNWSIRAKNKGAEKFEANVKAAMALKLALGAGYEKDWTCCHIWSVDDPAFSKQNLVVKDPRFYTCVANMVLLPTPLKAFTDSVPAIKDMLRTCSFYLYGWVCEHPEVREKSEKIKSGWVPKGYPREWPSNLTPDILPPNTATFSANVQKKIDSRKIKIKEDLLSEAMPFYPKQQVEDVLSFWNIDL